MPDPNSARTLDIVIQRQIESVAAGNGAYLATFLRIAKAAGYRVRVVMAPWRSFGNRPWSWVHPQFAEIVDEVAWPRTVQLGRYRVSTALRVWGRFAVRLYRAALMVLGRDVLIYSHLATPLDAEEQAEVVAECDASPADMTVAEYSVLAPLLKDLKRAEHTGVLMHDLLSERSIEFRRLGVPLDFKEFSVDEEAHFVAAADVCFYASRDEMARFSSLVPGADALWLRPQVPEYALPGEANTRPRAVYLGTRHAGNIDALVHLLEDIWPRVLARLPDAELCIVGNVCEVVTDAQTAMPGVKVLGRVADLASIGGPNSIGLAPTRLATGVSIKVAEYLTLGMPSVVYPKALQGFGDTLDDLVSIAEEPQAFAEVVVSYLQDAESRACASKSGRAQAFSRLSNDEVVSYLADLEAKSQ